jgi:hypothetical protein
MTWFWFNFAAIIVFLALCLHGAPLLPVLGGIGGACAIQFFRRRRGRRS